VSDAGTEPARLPGFYTTVGGGGQKQEAAWYKEHSARTTLGHVLLRKSSAGDLNVRAMLCVSLCRLGVRHRLKLG